MASGLGRVLARWAGVAVASTVLWVAAPAAPAQTPTVVFVVRHAERAAEPGPDPGLSVPGEVRAQSLAAALADARVDAVIATQYRRTQLTAAPLVRAAGVTPLILQTEPDVAAHARAVAEAVRGRYAGRTVLVVGHSNTVSAIIAALGGPAVLPPCDNEFANLWMLVLPPAGAVTLVRARYGAPDPPPADCPR